MAGFLWVRPSILFLRMQIKIQWFSKPDHHCLRVYDAVINYHILTGYTTQMISWF